MIESKDVVIVGGGPAGLSAALVLGRARKRVLVCDGGTPRNERAVHMHGFVSRDGVPPQEFRRLAREQFTPYDIECRNTLVASVERQPGGFLVSTDDGRTIEAKRLLLATGMVDVVPDIPGYREAWGHSIFQCPHCHGWEAKDGPWGLHATHPMLLDFALVLSGWSRDLVVFTGGAIEVPAEARERLNTARIQLVEQRIAAIHHHEGKLEAIELADGSRVERHVLFARPPQRQVPLVQQLGVALDEMGYIRIDEHKETSIHGIHAAGDLTTPIQGAMLSASEGMLAAAKMVHQMNVEAALQR